MQLADLRICLTSLRIRSYNGFPSLAAGCPIQFVEISNTVNDSILYFKYNLLQKSTGLWSRHLHVV